MIAVCAIPIALQGLAMIVDEAVFHRRRGLGRWERIGHPLDTLTIAACLIWLLAAPHELVVPGYVALAVFSTLFVTKDEWVHAGACSATEHWLHAVLFILHPIVLAAFAALWWEGHAEILAVQLLVVLAFAAYSNDLAIRGHRVTGLDAEADNLAVARAHDATGTVDYVTGDALALPFPDGSFDVVAAMDLLEHVEDPARLVSEAARVLAPGGLLVFHTFNRTQRANLIVIKGVTWFVANAPPDLHVLRMFITPDELTTMCDRAGLDIVELRGSRPRFTWPLWRMLFTGRVGDDFAFTFTRSLAIGYTGYARRR